MPSLRMQKKVKGKSLLSYSQNPHNLPIQQKKISPQWVLCTSSPSLLLPLLSSPISSQKNPRLSALFFQLPIDNAIFTGTKRSNYISLKLQLGSSSYICSTSYILTQNRNILQTKLQFQENPTVHAKYYKGSTLLPCKFLSQDWLPPRNSSSSSFSPSSSSSSSSFSPCCQ